MDSTIKEYVASLIGLYKNNGAVSCVGNYFLFIKNKQTLTKFNGRALHWPNLIPNRIGFFHGQILIENATYYLFDNMLYICATC